jgi:hypothetical protein
VAEVVPVLPAEVAAGVQVSRVVGVAAVVRADGSGRRAALRVPAGPADLVHSPEPARPTARVQVDWAVQRRA